MLETSPSLRQSENFGICEPNAAQHSTTVQSKDFHNNMVVEILNDISSLEAEWLALETQGTTAVYQSFSWVKTVLATIDKDQKQVIVTARTSGKLQMILPMIMEGGVIKSLRWAGGSHANIGGGLFSEEFLASADRQTVKKIIDHLRKDVPGTVLLRLGNQMHDLGGFKNPLSLFDHQKSVNAMFVMDLSNGFDAMLEAGNAKRKRRSFRKQVRIAEDEGGFELVEVNTEPDAIAAIAEFRAFKETRFRQMGIEDVFANDKAKAFLEQLATHKGTASFHPFKIYLLKIGGKTRAMYAGGLAGSYFQAAVNAISIDELTHISPGEMLLYLMVEKLASDGITKLDLGVGHERYKRSWCQHELELFDTVVPLSPLAIPAVWAAKLKVGIKGYVRGNPMLWQLIKKARRLKANA